MSHRDPLIAATPVLLIIVILGCLIAAATAGRAQATFACAVNGEIVEATLRRHAAILTPFGLVVTPDSGRPFVAETCEEFRR